MRGCWEGGAGTGVADVPVAGVVTAVSATTRELPSEEVSVSALSPPVPAMVLLSPSVPLVPSPLVDSASWVMWDAAPYIACASAPPPDDANAQGQDDKTKTGERQRIHWVSGCTDTTVGIRSILTNREQAYTLCNALPEEARDGRVAAVDPVDSEDEEAEDEDKDNGTAVIRQYFQ
ncbi:hypothetical protein NDU88_001961 [Pleurodeles waltl]|uniref:Uncharacterized protein n=1 Tax=Pleurodeles waltl TaxID=8319 RepID=A0AAV7NGA0_PLEWA|nr:hypothetical protein NDU88_001961 [Pleurodeles waltl]